MQTSKARASLFPYAVVLAIVVVNLIRDALNVYGVMRVLQASGDSFVSHGAFYFMLGNEFVVLVLSAAFGLAFTQWICEQRRVSGVPGYAAAGIGVVYILMSTALNFAWLSISLAIAKQLGAMGISIMSLGTTVVSHAITIVSVYLSILLIFRLLRHREVPAREPVELRGRALMIYTLFAWSWVLVITQVMVPTTAAMASSYGLDSAYGLDTGSLVLMAYAGSVGLALPAFLGAVAGLPGVMPYSQVPRLWLASMLATLICAIAMVVVTYVLVRIASALGVSSPGTGFIAFVTLAWFIVSIFACWLLVKSLMRKLAPPLLNVADVKQEISYQVD